MSDNESLESKYGRRKTTQSNNNSSTVNTNENKQNSENDISRYSRRQNEQTDNLKQNLYKRSSYNSETVSSKPQMIFSEEIKKQEVSSNPKNIKKNIEEALSQFNSGPIKHMDQVKKVPKETKLVKVLKTIVSVLIVLVILCIAVAMFMKPKINMESGEIIDQINNAEAMYYTMYKKYYYFSKTAYDSTLGIDMSIYNYFDSYEVLHNDETGNYEIKLYGATNAFTIVYYTIKSYLK